MTTTPNNDAALPTLLVVQASPAGQSQSRAVTDQLLAELSAAGSFTIVERDLASVPLPGLTTDAVAGMFRDPRERTRAEHNALRLSDMLIAELEAADAIVISSPMYNYTVSAQLKAWIDQIVMPGRTFRYGPDGLEGLLTARPVVVVTASGDVYDDVRRPHDFHVPYLEHILGFVGLTDVTFVQAAGVIYGVDGARERASGSLPAARARLLDALHRVAA